MITLTRAGRGRAFIALLAAGPLVLGTALGASAQPDEPLSIDNLPTLDEATISQQRQAIDVPDITSVTIPPEIAPFEPEVSSQGGDTIVTLNTDVLFEFGKAKLSDPAQEAVRDAVDDVPKKAKVHIDGFTDSVGSTADNLALSKKRAREVADVIEKDRDDLDLTVKGRGEQRPVAPNESGGKDNPEGREKNRRVEIRYAD